MRRSATPRWLTAFWIGWYMRRTGSSCKESRCGRRGADVAAKMASKKRAGRCFWALTPVALRAPSVSAQKHQQPKRQQLLSITTKKANKTLDGCRSLFHTKRVLRRLDRKSVV